MSVFPPLDAQAGSHRWRINEVFSDAAATVQDIEMRQVEEGATEQHLGGKNFFTSLFQNPTPFTFPNDLEPPTGLDRNFLMATQAFADLPGAPTPDFLVPAPFFTTGDDELRLSTYDIMTFGAGQLPTDGTTSLNRDFSTGTATPTNFAGETLTMDEAPAPGIPALPATGSIVLAALIAAGAGLLFRLQRS